MRRTRLRSIIGICLGTCCWVLPSVMGHVGSSKVGVAVAAGAVPAAGQRSCRDADCEEVTTSGLQIDGRHRPIIEENMDDEEDDSDHGSTSSNPKEREIKRRALDASSPRMPRSGGSELNVDRLHTALRLIPPIERILPRQTLSSNAPQIQIGYVVPQIDNTTEPLREWFAMVIDYLQYAGMLPGANISMVAAKSLDIRPLAVQAISELAKHHAVGFVGVASMYSQDAAYEAGIFNLPYCEGNAFSSNYPSDGFPSFIRVVPDHFQRITAKVKLMERLGWFSFTLLNTFALDSQTDAKLSALPNADKTKIYYENFVPAYGGGTSVDYMPQMNRIALSRSAIFVCEMDGRSLGLAIRTAQPLGMTSPPYVWIITGEAYRWLKLYEPATISMLSWALVIFPQGGTGDAYTWMTERWNTTDFQSRYPTLTGVYLDPPDEFLPYHACLDLLIRGYDAISHANNTNNISQIASGWSGPIIPKLNVSTNFSCPKYQTVLGYMDFTNGNTVIAPYKYYYLANGKLNYFGYSKSTTDLEIVSPIIFSDGSEVIPSQTIAQFAPEPFNWKLVILAPLIAVVLIFLGSGGLLYLWLAAKHRRRTELDLDTKPLGHIPKFDLSGTAQKAMELLRDARDPAKKRKITLDDIDFLMEVLNSGGTNAFNPMLELQGPEGVKVDAETRAWVLGMLATGGQSSSVAASGGAPIPVSRQSSDSTNPDIRRVSRGLLDGKRQSAVEKSRTSMMPDSMSGIAVGSGGIVMGYEPQGATSMVGGAQGLRQRRGSFGGMTSGTTPRTVPRHLADSFESTRSGMVGGVSRQLDDPQYHTPLTRELSSTDQVKIMDYLSIWYHSWNFDMFQFNEMTDGHPLYYSGVYLFQSNQALNSLHLDLDKFKRWILLMEGEYHPHPYHNATHAADVLHALNFLLIEDPIGAHYTPLEVLALVMSAVGHDIDHPGYNNNFLVKSHHPWAILYCDASVLELHHCAHMFSMTLSSPFNIFADLTNEEFDELRRIVIRLILATDMGKHFEYINKFKAKLTASTLKFDTVETRMIVAEIALKCSDLCNPTKTFALSSKWTEAVMEEFYMQGDRERELGLAISQFMDRGNTNVPKCQIGFIDILVAPLYDAWATFQTTEKVGKIVREIGKNRQNWVGLTLSQTIHAQNQQGSLSSGQSTTSVASRTPGMASTTRAAGFAAGLPSVNSSSGALGGSRLAGSGSIRSGHESVTSQSQDLLSSSPFPPVPSAPTGPTSSIIPTTTTTTATAPGSPLTTPYLLHHQQSHPSQQQLSASALSNPRRPGLNSSQTSGGGSTTNTSITPVGSLLRHREMGQDIRDLGGVIMNTGNEEIDTLAGLAADDRV